MATDHFSSPRVYALSKTAGSYPFSSESQITTTIQDKAWVYSIHNRNGSQVQLCFLRLLPRGRQNMKWEWALQGTDVNAAGLQERRSVFLQFKSSSNNLLSRVLNTNMRNVAGTRHTNRLVCTYWRRLLHVICKASLSVRAVITWRTANNKHTLPPASIINHMWVQSWWR